MGNKKITKDSPSRAELELRIAMLENEIKKDKVKNEDNRRLTVNVQKDDDNDLVKGALLVGAGALLGGLF